MALQCRLMKRSPSHWFAKFARWRSSMKTSLLRVSFTLKPSSARFLRKSFATARTISFSWDFLPEAPGSLPPCPGSITMVRTSRVPAISCFGAFGFTTTGCAGFCSAGFATGLAASILLEIFLASFSAIQRCPLSSSGAADKSTVRPLRVMYGMPTANLSVSFAETIENVFCTGYQWNEPLISRATDSTSTLAVAARVKLHATSSKAKISDVPWRREPFPSWRRGLECPVACRVDPCLGIFLLRVLQYGS